MLSLRLSWNRCGLTNRNYFAEVGWVTSEHEVRFAKLDSIQFRSGKVLYSFVAVVSGEVIFRHGNIGWDILSIAEVLLSHP